MKWKFYYKKEKIGTVDSLVSYAGSTLKKTRVLPIEFFFASSQQIYWNLHTKLHYF